MGTTVAPSGIADALFSKVEQRVLGLLFGQPERSFRGAELVRLAASGTGATHRVMTRLAAAGLVTVSRVGNQKHYRANPRSSVFAELRDLMQKTAGLAAPIGEGLSPLNARIRAAFVFGSIAGGTDDADSDIDLMVIGEGLSYSEVYEALQPAERRLDRKINPSVLSPSEWKRRLRARNPFVENVAGKPKLFLIGGQDVLT